MSTPDFDANQYNAALRLEPTPLQAAFITSPVEETLYGGARGGGKTFAVIIDWLIHSDAYGKFARGIVFRRTLVELDDFIENARAVLEAAGHVWQDQKKRFVSPKGAILRCRYLDNDADAEKYQGHAYTRIYIEEIGNFPNEKPIRKLFGALRPPFAGGPPIRCQFKATANPGGPGQTWVKARYIDPAPARTPFSVDGGRRYRVFIPAKLADNPHLNKTDDYKNRLSDVGSAELVRAWLEGDWDAVVGQYFSDFRKDLHVIPTVALPPYWKVRYRSCDWGSAKPFAVYWFAVADGTDIPGVDQHIPRGALVVYRELYGWNGTPNVGPKWTASQVGKAIVQAEHGVPCDSPVAFGGVKGMNDHRIVDEENAPLNKIDPATFATNGGPSIAEEIARAGAWFKRADNRRVAGKDGGGPVGGWNQVRGRLRGDGDYPMIFFMDCCTHLIRTLPMIPADPDNMDDVDSESEDHAVDALRYGCMARPFTPAVHATQQKDKFARSLYSFTLDDAWQCRTDINTGPIAR